MSCLADRLVLCLCLICFIILCLCANTLGYYALLHCIMLEYATLISYHIISIVYATTRYAMLRCDISRFPRAHARRKERSVLRMAGPDKQLQ